jgi:hypothetical protein
MDPGLCSLLRGGEYLESAVPSRNNLPNLRESIRLYLPSEFRESDHTDPLSHRDQASEGAGEAE